MLTDAELEKLTPYLSVIPRRHPMKKIHMTLGHARAAISTSGYGRSTDACQIYEYTTSGWQLLHDVPRGTAFTELPWKKEK